MYYLDPKLLNRWFIPTECILTPMCYAESALTYKDINITNGLPVFSDFNHDREVNSTSPSS